MPGSLYSYVASYSPAIATREQFKRLDSYIAKSYFFYLYVIAG